MPNMNNVTELSDDERQHLARDLHFFQVTEAHTWLKTEDDIRSHIEHNFEDVYGNSLHAVKVGMDYTVYAWRTKAAHQRIVDRWNEILSWDNADAPKNMRGRGVRFRKPHCTDGDYAVWANGVYIGDIRRAHLPGSPSFPSSGRNRIRPINGWEAIVEDMQAARYKTVWHGFQRSRMAAAFQLFVCAMDQRPFAVRHTRINRGHV